MSHALLSASGSKKWLACTPSVRLEEQFPETISVYAEEGTLAHEICELKVRKQFVEPMGPRKFNNRLKKFKEHELYNDEMLRHTDTYLDYISGIAHGYNSPPYVAVEKKVSYDDYAPEGFGTVDCILIAGSDLHIIDFKYGKGIPVSAEYNTQMMLYALGTYTEYSFLYPIEKVKMSVVQPRLDNMSEFELTLGELLSWGESIIPIALKAFNGQGEFVSGEHCRFCKAKSVCRARANNNTALEDFKMQVPPILSNDEVGDLIKRGKHLAKWVSDLEDYALSELLKGEEVAGWKAVHGRATRKFTDIDKAFEIVKQNGTPESLLYERKPLTLTALESLIGKKDFTALLGDYVQMPPGKPTLADISDKREPIRRDSAGDDFSD